VKKRCYALVAHELLHVIPYGGYSAKSVHGMACSNIWQSAQWW